MSDLRIPRRLSPSSIDRFRECPRRFLWQDIERRGGDDASASPELAVGKAVHEVLDLVFRLQAGERTAENFERLLAAVWRKHWRKELLGTAAEPHARDDARRLLENFRRCFAVTEAEPLKREYWLRLKLPAVGLEVSTRVDRIDRGRTGLRVIDYKTGRRQVEAGDLPRDTAAMIHLLAISQLANEQVERVSHYYLRSGEEIYWEPEPDDLDAVVERVQKQLKQMLNEREFEPLPGDGCRLCAFALQCDARPAPLGIDQLIAESERAA